MHNAHQERQAISTWINRFMIKRQDSLMVTLGTVFKPIRYLSREYIHDCHLESLSKPQNKLRYFLHKLNQKVFKTAYFKHNRRVELVSVYELDSNDDYHYHCLVARPKTKDGQPYPFSKLQQHIRESWAATGSGSKKGVFDITPIYSEKAHGYCQKFKKGVRLENVDWINSYIESV